MCLLSFYPSGVRPIESELFQGSVFNSDGHGFAIVDGDKMITDRGFDAATMIERFVEARATHPNGPALFHSRLATHGTRSPDNIHPFYVDNDRRTVLAHNGILPAKVQPRKGDKRSDTHVLADSLAGRFGSMRHRRNREILAKWMGTYNKIVILTTNRRFGEQSFILNEDEGIWTSDGIWYSNDGYRPSGIRAAWHYGYWDDMEEDSEGTKWYRDMIEGWKPSWVADSKGTVLGPRAIEAGTGWVESSVVCYKCAHIMDHTELELGWCSICDRCQDCYSPSDECQCWHTENERDVKYDRAKAAYWAE